MRGKAIVVAVALVLVGCGGGAVWLAANDDDHPSAGLFSDREAAPATPPAATAPEQQPTETQPTEAQPSDTGPQVPETEETVPPEQATPPAPSSGSPGGAPKRKTHFKREPRKPADDEPQRRFAVPPAREFSGEGNAHLGTVDVTTTAVLKWSSKGHLEIRFGRESFPIVAPTRSGQLVLPPYRFEQVRVVAAGPWKISISPQ